MEERRLSLFDGAQRSVAREASPSPRVARSCGLPPIALPRDNDAAALALACEAAKLEAACDPGCVDLYFAAAVRQWQKLAELGAMPTSDDLLHRARTYNAELAKLLVTAQRFGRFDAVNGLHVLHEGQMLAIPVAFYGFAWSPEDFNQLELVGDYEPAKYVKKVRSDGVGAPLVVRRIRPADERFFRCVQPFAATAVLRPIAKLEPVPDQVSIGDEVDDRRRRRDKRRPNLQPRRGRFRSGVL